MNNVMTLGTGLINHEVFTSTVNEKLFNGRMNDSQRSGIMRLIHAWHQYGNGLDTAMCYVLATSYWETGRRMQPVLETFATTRAQGAARLQRAFDRGQLRWVKTPYWDLRNGHHWIGGGDVQLTHEYNYRGPLRTAVLDKFDKDIYTDPNLVLDPEISAYILIEGMMIGDTAKSDFTSHELEKYINESKTDYHNARKTVNPGDRSSYAEIAAIAGDFHEALGRARVAAGSQFQGPQGEIYDGRYSAQVEDVQRSLKRLGYTELGTIDGRWGARTRAAVLAFRADNGLPLVPRIDGDLLGRLVGGEPRAVSQARSEATVDDLREAGSTDVARNDSVRRMGTAAVGVGGVATVAEETGVLDLVSSVSENTDQIHVALDVLERVKSTVSDNALVLLMGMGALVIYMAWKGNQNRVAKHRTGEYVSR